jgi:hypothetical protein
MLLGPRSQKDCRDQDLELKWSWKLRLININWFLARKTSSAMQLLHSTLFLCILYRKLR